MPKTPPTRASTPGKELDTFKRRLAILQCLKRGQGRSVRELMQQLAMQQIQASERSVQRDLLILSARHGYPIESDGQNPALDLARAGEDISLPGTDPATALALIMLQKHAKNLLPPDAPASAGAVRRRRKKPWAATPTTPKPAGPTASPLSTAHFH
ncbi:MAG: hypothetical protein IPO08_18280 [Xanthomonadales bacterium]|nr:hypothetical protein [Xanthomonadales bacterium]